MVQTDDVGEIRVGLDEGVGVGGDPGEAHIVLQVDVGEEVEMLAQVVQVGVVGSVEGVRHEAPVVLHAYPGQHDEE